MNTGRFAKVNQIKGLIKLFSQPTLKILIQERVAQKHCKKTGRLHATPQGTKWKTSSTTSSSTQTFSIVLMIRMNCSWKTVSKHSTSLRIRLILMVHSQIAT